MTIMVCIKRVIDPYARVRLLPDASGVDTVGVKMSVNPFDEIALEAAVQLKEAGHDDDIVVVSVGNAAADEALRTALAMGATRAVRINSDAHEPLAIAQLLAVLWQRELPRITLCGKQAIDDDCNQVGQMLAALCGLPQATFASHIDVQGLQAVVTRETDAGLEKLAVPLPALITTDLRLNTPRYAPLPAVLKARKTPIEVLEGSALGVDTTPRLQILAYAEPPARAAGRAVASASDLVQALQQRGVL